MSKLIILTRLTPFLQEDDINRFASICRSLRKLVYSPMGMKIITVAKTKNLAIHFQNNILDKVSMSRRQKEFGGFGVLGSGANERDFEVLQKVR